MSGEDHVLGLLTKANPVPDPIAYAARARHEAIEQRSGDMTETNVRTIEPAHDAPAKRGWMTGLAAAAVILIVGIGGFVFWSTTGGDDAAASDPAVATVEAAYDALNDYDLAAWEELNTPLALAVVGDIPAVTINMGSQYEIVEECRVIEEQADGDVVVQCGVRWTDDYQGPAGITPTYTETHTVNAEGLIWKTEDDLDLDESFAYNRAFWAWMEAAHPDVYAEITPIDSESFPGYQTDPADALVALEYVDEFLAQSDEYPTGG